MCDCPCDSVREENSPQCNGNGTLVCGLCECSPLHSGSQCACLKSESKDKALCAVGQLPGRRFVQKNNDFVECSMFHSEFGG